MKIKLRWLLLLLPFALLAVGTRILVPLIGDSIAKSFTTLATERDHLESQSAERSRGDGGHEDRPTRVPWTWDDDDAGALPAAATMDAGASRPHALFVPARVTARVAPIAARQVHGTAAMDAKGRPLGVRLSGVGALGVGLADGDILTSVVGQPTLDVDAATGAIAAATASGKRRVSAAILRETGGAERKVERIFVTEELPEPSP